MTGPRPEIAVEHIPGDRHMWVMVLGDMVIFAGYFVVFMVHRAMDPGAYLAAQRHLDITAGVLNTLVLLTSSWLVARAVLAARAGAHALAVRLTRAAACCGVVFLAVKTYEWATKIAGGHTVSEEFFAFYYVLTGVHALHVALGLLVLGIVVRELRGPRRRMSMVEAGAVYWHMVDLLWIVVFALFYVLR